MSMKAVMFFVPFMLLNIACDAQQNKKKTETIKSTEQQQPQTGWKVTKELDDFKNFTRPDYFTHKWRNKEFDIQSFMKQMNSLRNAFLKENYPGLEKKNQEMRL